MTEQGLRIHILGIVSLNGGDAAILQAQVLLLRRRWPDARIVVHDRDAVAAARYLPSLQFAGPLAEVVTRPPRLLRARGGRTWRRAMQLKARMAGRLRSPRLLPTALRGMDLALYTGGTSLTENYRLAPKVADLELVRRAGIPYAFLPQSAGPFEQAENRAALRPVLADAALVMLRDDRSLRYVLDVGAAPERCVVVPDVVFALAREDLGASPEPSPDEGGAARPERLAVSVREWRHFTTRPAEEGRAAMVAAFRFMVTTLVRERGLRVTFVSTCQGRPEYTHDDSVFAAEVVAGLPDDVVPAVEVDGDLYDAEGLIERLASFDALVSMRLHAAILGVCSGLPTLTVAYEYKSTEVWHQLGMTDWTLDLETLDGSELTERAISLLDRRADVRAHLAPRVSAFRDRALALGDDVAEAIAAHPRVRAAVTSARR